MATTAGFSPPDDSRDVELLILCDQGATTAAPTRFMRRVTYGPDGTQVSTVDTLLDGTTPYVVAGTVSECESTEDEVLPPMTVCRNYDIMKAFPVEDGRSFRFDLPIRNGFAVRDVRLGTELHTIALSWLPTDTDGTVFARSLELQLESAIGHGANVTVAPVTTASICDDEPSVFRITVDCMPDRVAPAFMLISYDAGQDLIQNPGMALTSYDAPVGTGQQDTRTPRQNFGGRVLCTDGPINSVDEGWETSDPANGGNGQGNFEVWPRYENGTPASGDGGNFVFYDVTPTPRSTNAWEINAEGTNNVVWQTFTVESDGAYNIAATFGGRGETETIGVRFYTGDVTPTPALPGDVFDVDVQARNVTGLGGPNAPADVVLQKFPWTEYQDTVFLTAGTYTFALVGPNTGVATGGLIADLRVYASQDTFGIFQRTEDCTYQRESIASIDQQCEVWQPLVSSTVPSRVDRWVRLDTEGGQVLTNEDFWQLDPPPQVDACCSEPPADPADPTLVDGDLPDQPQEYVTEVCAVIGGRRQTMFRRVLISDGGFVLSEVFIGDNGVRVTPSEWEPGACALDRNYTEQARMLDVTPGSPYVPMPFPDPGRILVGMSMTVIEGTAEVTDFDGTVISNIPVGYSASWGEEGHTELQPPQQITTTGRVLLVGTSRTES